MHDGNNRQWHRQNGNWKENPEQHRLNDKYSPNARKAKEVEKDSTRCNDFMRGKCRGGDQSSFSHNTVGPISDSEAQEPIEEQNIDKEITNYISSCSEVDKRVLIYRGCFKGARNV